MFFFFIAHGKLLMKIVLAKYSNRKANDRYDNWIVCDIIQYCGRVGTGSSIFREVFRIFSTLSSPMECARLQYWFNKYKIQCPHLNGRINRSRFWFYYINLNVFLAICTEAHCTQTKHMFITLIYAPRCTSKRLSFDPSIRTYAYRAKPSTTRTTRATSQVDS